jgi:hypothetical protein
MRSRRGIGEVVGSVAMLAVTIALLAGASAVAVLSIQAASELADKSAQDQRENAGLLVSVVTTQTNSSGTFVWLFDYGWTSAGVKSVYDDGQQVGWSSTCNGDWTESVCVVTLPPVRGDLTILIGGVSIAATV